MSPLEAAIRAVCEQLGAHPDTWRGFEEVGRAGLKAFVEALPPEIAAEIRKHVALEAP